MALSIQAVLAIIAANTTDIKPSTHDSILRTERPPLHTTMKFIAAITLIYATLALSNPAPLTSPAVPESVPEFRHALMGRAAAGLPQLDDRASKPKGSSGGSSGNSSTAVSVSPSGTLMMGALGLGLMGVVRLWN
ncbi:hypothetical protein BU25DRAFT_418202 [Macroventuria anomochaeta]|uniref:Uncharacterized protein n=1 Tax=Macroventuria anomochaeta TaxID=301207 RepID=A0ACB6SBG5_9PLEO|nr:uncharacterized protein BU25DRAFT_418202 [Macroventuria anomochaeta]KAF2631399.1 hypothetical protein BU25DRAFT_418202 [Macroventuria anomochaeta]